MIVGDALETLDTLVRLGLSPTREQSHSWLFPVILTRRAVWLAVAAAIALTVPVAWCLWTAHLQGVQIWSTIGEGCSLALPLLLLIGLWAVARSMAAVRAARANLVPQIDSFGDVTFMLDRGFAFRSVSPAFKGMFGVEAASVLGTPGLQMIHPSDWAAVQEMLEALMNGQERAESLHRCQHVGGHWLWVAFDLRLVRHAGTARPEAILGVARDVTRWKDAEIRLEAANRRLSTLALEDTVTGLSNRRRFDEALSLEFRRSTRSGNPLSLLMIDVDFFKKFNDVHGHQAGDLCLRAIARTIQAETQRPGDVAARFGGEEFVVLLPSTGMRGAMVMAERIRAAVETRVVTMTNEGQAAVTVSIGVSSAVPQLEQRSANGLVNDADRALYAAKANGRNQVCAGIPERRQPPECRDPATASAEIARVEDTATESALVHAVG